MLLINEDNMKFLKIFFIFVAAVLLTACVAVDKWQKHVDAKKDYRTAAPLVVPADMSYLKADNYYPIPALKQTTKQSSNLNQEKLMLPPRN